MKTIWKYVVAPTYEKVVMMPANAHIISAALQGNDICLWAEVDSDAPLEPRTILMYGTGGPFESGHRFIDTVLLYNESLVVHVYEE